MLLYIVNDFRALRNRFFRFLRSNTPMGKPLAFHKTRWVIAVSGEKFPFSRSSRDRSIRRIAAKGPVNAAACSVIGTPSVLLRRGMRGTGFIPAGPAHVS